MVNVTFEAADQAEGRAVLAKMYPEAAGFISKLSVEPGSVVTIDDQLDGKTAVRIRVAAVAST